MKNLPRQITVDASLVVKWFLREDYSEQALNLLRAFQAGAVSLNAPTIMHYEVGNALWVLTARRSQIDRQYAGEAYNSLLSLPLETVQLNPSSLREAFDRACELSITLYDATYLAVAERTGSQFVSADLDLVKRSRGAVDSIHLSELRI